jgi:hypothetical protein
VVNGFKPGVFANPNELTMDDIKITFDGQNAGMLAPFKAALENLGYKKDVDYWVDGNMVKVKFTQPKSEQPRWNNFPYSMLKSSTQVKNQSLCAAYNAAKAQVGVNDNSPSSINMILDKIPVVDLFF